MLLVMSVSQPSAGLRLQSAHPIAHPTIPQFPPLHTVVVFAFLQSVRQEPQWAGSLRRLISQPSTGTMLQSAKKPVHMSITHFPPWHEVVALGREQAWLQPPQF